MKINPASLEGIYDSAANNNVTSNSQNEDIQIENKDRVDFSEASLNHSQLDDIKADATNEAEKGTDPDKLRRLKAELQNGTYTINSSDIANAMLMTNEKDT